MTYKLKNFYFLTLSEIFIPSPLIPKLEDW